MRVGSVVAIATRRGDRTYVCERCALLRMYLNIICTLKLAVPSAVQSTEGAAATTPTGLLANQSFVADAVSKRSRYLAPC